MHPRCAQRIGKCWRRDKLECGVDAARDDVADLGCYGTAVDEYMVDADTP
jgi:hypothetical protein